MKKLSVIKNVMWFCFALWMTVPAYANEQKPILNKVVYNTMVEGWVATNTARVIINVNASLNENQMGTLREQILTNLKKINANADWHITDFQRTQDQSGLEQISVQAEARIVSSELDNLRKQMEGFSVPGQKYTINDIQFVPSATEIEAVKSQLRNEIYKNVTVELQQLNQQYPNEKFYLHNIQFGGVGTEPRPALFMAKAVQAQAAEGGAMDVSNKVVINATVEMASVMPTSDKKQKNGNSVDHSSQNNSISSE